MLLLYAPIDTPQGAVIASRNVPRGGGAHRQDGEMATKRSRGKKTSNRRERPIFYSIRKPSAPPGQPMGQAKPQEKARPSGRKAKHKRKPEVVDKEDLI